MRFSHALLAARVLHAMGRGRPAFLSFNVANRCNERCPMCGVPGIEAAELGLSDLEPIFSDARLGGVEVVELSGGEPFLRTDLFELMAMLDRVGLFYTFTTNGTILPDGAVERLARARNLIQLGVSVDSLDRGTFARLRGRDALPEVLRNLEALASARLPFFLKVNFTVSRLNVGEGSGMLEFARSRGLFLSAFPVNQGASMAHRRLDPLFETGEADRQAIAGLFRSFAELRRRGEPLWEYSGFYETCARFALGEPLGPCDAGRLYLDLRADGQLGACVDLEPFGSLVQLSLPHALERLPGQAGPIANCWAGDSCCYTCTRNVSVTARNRFAFARETARVFLRRWRGSAGTGEEK